MFRKKERWQHTKKNFLGKGRPNGLRNFHSLLTDCQYNSKTLRKPVKQRVERWHSGEENSQDCQVYLTDENWTFIYMANFTFQWIKCQSSNHYITFFSLLWNFEYATSMLKTSLAGQKHILYQFCSNLSLLCIFALTIYTLIKLLFQWKNQLFDILSYLDITQLTDACTQNPEWTIQPPNLTSRDHWISPSHPPLSRIQSQRLKVWATLSSLRGKIKCFFLFVSKNAKADLFDKIPESTYWLVLNIYFLASLLTKSCINFSIFWPHMMSSLSTSNPSCLNFLNEGTSAPLQSSEILLNIDISNPSN